MRKLFSTAEVDQRDRFDYWHEVACKHVIKHTARPSCRLSFNAELEGDSIGPIGLVQFANSAMDVSHTSRHVSTVQSDDVFVCLQRSGALALEQDREVTLNAGDMTLLDPLQPYLAHFSPLSKLLVLKVPRRELEARIGKTREMVARLMRPIDSERRLASSYLAMLPAHTGLSACAAETIISDHVLDLVAIAMAKTTQGHLARISSARSIAVLRIRTAIESRLSDPNLNPMTVAAAAGISVRYASALLAQDGTSLYRLILALRLERCRKCLEDPIQVHRTISDIAYGWGFSDMTHFSRNFKKVYGALPRDYRRLPQGSQPGRDRDT